MIDFHTHIIPNIDDGSKSIEETFELIKEAKNAGFDKIISTSHYMEDYYEVVKSDRKAWIDAITKTLDTQNFNMNLYLGNEIYISSNIVKLIQEQKACTINNTNYVLFELPLNTDKPLNLYDIIYELLENKYIPILAHPERYLFVQKNPDIIFDLIQIGVLMQSNFGSFIGQYGKKAKIIAEKLLQNDMVHFLGSDVHRQNTIYKKIPQIIKQLELIIGNEKLEEITSLNPTKVLQNMKIEIQEPKKIKLSLKEKIKLSLN